MAYTPHSLVTFGGSWFSQTAEIWACNIRLAADGGGGVTLDEEAYMNEIAAPLATWYALAASSIAADAVLKFLKVNRIGADGKYASRTLTNLHTYSPMVGGGTTASLPSFCTIATSWSTAIVRGPACRGRIYLPNYVYGVTAGSRLTTSNRGTVAEAGKALLTVLRNASGADGRKGTPVIASNIGGAIQPITGVWCDDVYDVQRRRKNRIKPARSAVLAFP